MTWAASTSRCSTILTKGVFLSSAPDCNTADSTLTFDAGGIDVLVATTLPDASGSSTLSASDGTTSIAAAQIVVLTAMAKGVFLPGQTTAAESGQDLTLSQESSSPIAGALIGSVVGGVLGSIGLLCLIFCWPKRCRRKRKQADDQVRNIEKVYYIHDHLHGSGKAELDASASATRNELQGSLGDDRERGAGIYVRKPELEGTPGVSGAGRAVYVLNKAELEAPQHTERAELEAIPISKPNMLLQPIGL